MADTVMNRTGQSERETRTADYNTDAEATQGPSEQDAALKSLDRLIGRWADSGPGLSGQSRFEWMEGGRFLLQHVNLVQGDQHTRGIEIIGYDEQSKSLKSHYFDCNGSILEYTWEVSDDTLTIWYGDAGSAAAYRGKFSPDGNSCSGAWEWPGGGYESNMTRM